MRYVEDAVYLVLLVWLIPVFIVLGCVAVGVDAIREVWAGFIALGGQIGMTTRYAVEADEVALLSNSWTFTMDGAEVAGSITSEVARRQPDGTWRYVIDNPYGVPAS